MTGTLHGRSFAEWSKINDVLEKHCIGNAKTLENALKRPERRIPVYDAMNRARFLGTLPPIEMSPGTHHYRMAIMPSLNSVYVTDAPPFNPRTQSIEFTVDVDHCTLSAVYLTRAPLDLLLRIGTFHLPGESEKQAQERHYRQG
jgi:hypothetical protein